MTGITTPSEFDDATAFERFALELVPLAPTTSTGEATLELRPDGTRLFGLTLTATVGAEAVADVVHRMRPLLFGAAWKVIDLLYELALYQARIGPDLSRGYSIAKKMSYASACHGICPPLSSLNQEWERLLLTFAATEEVRHSLVHRKALVDNRGAIVGTDRQGKPLTPLSAEEQSAFCRVAQRAGNAVLTGTISCREREDLDAQLDLLVAVHGRALLGARAGGSIQRVRVGASKDPNGDWHLDFPGWRAWIGSSGAWQYDAEIHCEGESLVLLCALEEAPNVPLTIDPLNPPTWLVRVR